MSLRHALTTTNGAVKYRGIRIIPSHRLACIMPDSSNPAAVRSCAMPTGNECPVRAVSMSARLAVTDVIRHALDVNPWGLRRLPVAARIKVVLKIGATFNIDVQ